MNSREQLMATKPKRENFPNEEAFDEAHHYWMSHAGRILSVTAQRFKASQNSTKSDSKSER